MKKSKCLVTYHRFYNVQFEGFSNLVFFGIYTNASVFVAPPVTEANFKTTHTAYKTAAAEYATYGITKRTAFYDAKQQLMAILDRLSDYVNEVADGDVSIIVLSGFENTRATTQEARPLPSIVNFSIQRTNVVGQFVVTIPSLLAYGEVSYCCICSESEPLPNTNMVNGQMKLASNGSAVFFDFNKSRHKVFNSLKPGTMYFFQVFAVNTVSVSPVTLVKNMMAA